MHLEPTVAMPRLMANHTSFSSSPNHLQSVLTYLDEEDETLKRHYKLIDMQLSERTKRIHKEEEERYRLLQSNKMKFRLLLKNLCLEYSFIEKKILQATRKA